VFGEHLVVSIMYRALPVCAPACPAVAQKARDDIVNVDHLGVMAGGTKSFRRRRSERG
jgi:hypothetical protein